MTEPKVSPNENLQTLPKKDRTITLEGARQNNLKNITVRFPYRKLSVVTGLSGSGKSSLAFDTLYAEGQRRFIDSLSTYTRQFLQKMPKPDLDRAVNIPPAIALEQRNSVFNSRSTVGTQTEVIDYLRVLYARVGETECTQCGGPVVKMDSEFIANNLISFLGERRGVLGSRLVLQAAAVVSDAKTKKKKGTTKAAAPTLKKTQLRLDSIFRVLREQGFNRILLKYSATEFEMLSLDDEEALSKIPKSLIERNQIYVVNDRFKFSRDQLASSETKTRLLDSIETALKFSQNEVFIFRLDENDSRSYQLRFACTLCQTEHREPEPSLFSFNSPLGACPHCNGFGNKLEIDEAKVVPDPGLTLKNGAIDPMDKPSYTEWKKDFFRFCDRQGISTNKRYSQLTASEKKVIWEGNPKDSTFPGILGFFDELAKKKYKLHVRVFIRRYQSESVCKVCDGARLSLEARAVKVGKKSFPEFLDLPVEDSFAFLKSLKFEGEKKTIIRDVYPQIEKRLFFLNQVGLSYLTLSRQTRSLSGGEFQRINLSAQLGNGLCGTLYVLDEPSIGLHAKDTERLLSVLEALRDQGNTLVVVEHDLEVIRRADYLVEIGPLAGARGGECLSQGKPSELIAKNTLTGAYLSGAKKLMRERPLRPRAEKFLRLTGCREHNLKNITVEFPLERLVVVTGVSGSGKTTLVNRTLVPALQKQFARPGSDDEVSESELGKFDKLYGANQLQGVIALDQKPIGRNSRSNALTYMGGYDDVRKIFAAQSLSLRRGYTPQFFSFNVDGGRCPVCKGEGEISIDMHFMAEIRLICEECEGRRFKKEILDVRYRGKNIHELLHTTIDEAIEIFREQGNLKKKLLILKEVGLGYLNLGQSATTLSGGESQRLKVARSLDEQATGKFLYVFDEPTTGLHLEDIKKLMEVIQTLVDQKKSVILIEHHLDVIAMADHVIDIGPGGGEKGGEVIASCSPAKLIQNLASVTGEMLKKSGYEFQETERAYDLV